MGKYLLYGKLNSEKLGVHMHTGKKITYKYAVPVFAI